LRSLSPSLLDQKREDHPPGQRAFAARNETPVSPAPNPRPINAFWPAVSPQTAPTVGDLLYATLGSIAAGMIASAFRWAVFDTLYHRTGIPPPAWLFSTLHQKLEAFHTLVEIHDRYYQFYANMLVALTFTYVAHRTTLPRPASLDPRNRVV